jgi:hypothetical protein
MSHYPNMHKKIIGSHLNRAFCLCEIYIPYKLRLKFLQ